MSRYRGRYAGGGGSGIPASGGTFTGDIAVPDDAYDATNWNGSLEAPTKNALRDKIESMIPTVASYQPTNQAVLSTTSTSFADVDATNAAWAFTAPPSGRVLLTASAYTDAVSTNLGTGDEYVWGLHDGSADVANTAIDAQRCQTVNIVEQGRVRAEWLVTGLTPGAACAYKLRHKVDGATVTGRIIAGTKDTATVVTWGPLVTTVFPL